MERKKSRVNIVIPVYNTERFIETTIKCLLNQTVQDFFAVFVNDGSTDGTLDILENYQKADDRFVVLSQENRGPGAARNMGLDYIYEFDSDYTIILDADDIYGETMLEDMIDKAEKTKADIVICRGKEYDNMTGNCAEMPYSLKYELLPKGKDVFCYKDIKDYIFNFCVGWSWDKLYRTEFIKGTNLRFQEIRNSDDAYFVFISLVKASSITYTNKIHVSHRLNVSSSVSNSRDKNITCFYEAVIAIKNELFSMGIYEEIEKGFLNWALNFCIWDLSTSKPEVKQEVYDFVKNTCFVELGIATHDRSFYSFENDYNEYKRIASCTYEQYISADVVQQKESMLKKLFRSLKRSGLKNTLKKVHFKLKSKK